MEEKKAPATDQEKEIISNLNDEFKKKNYNAAIQLLNKLEISSSPSSAVNPLKVTHNKAVVEFFKSDFRKCENFRKVLVSITGLSGDFNVVEIKQSSLCPIYYNQAVLLFHSKQPYSAIKIMKAILLHIDHLEDSFIEKAGLLTVCLLLDTNQAKKADHLLEMLQNRLDINNDDILLPDDDVEPVEKKKEILDEDQEIFRNLFRLALIRSHLFNSKNALIPNEETSNFSILKGHQYYLGNDFQMAAKELSKPFKDDLVSVKKFGEEQNVCLANNMGLIHFSVKHYALAVRFFQKALLFDQRALEGVKKDYNTQPPLHCLGATKRPDILYNLGIALLYLQRPKDAFDCLLVPLNIYHKNPKLWLRVAESCIMVHKQHLKESELQNKNIVSSVIGSGMHRKYIITPTPHKFVTDEQSSAIPSPNLEFASLCLRNALTLINYYSSLANSVEIEGKAGSSSIKSESFSLFGNNWNKVDDGISCNPSKPLTKLAIDKLKVAILAASSYVGICLGDYTLALQYAKEMLDSPHLPDTHKMLGHLYAAESLIMLDLVPEAIKILDPKLMVELQSVDFETRGSPDWNINTIEAAQSVLAYNLAVALVLFGDYETARARMAMCRHPVVYNRFKMLELYLELKWGYLDNCKDLIQKDTPQYY